MSASDALLVELEGKRHDLASLGADLGAARAANAAPGVIAVLEQGIAETCIAVERLRTALARGERQRARRS